MRLPAILSVLSLICASGTSQATNLEQRIAAVERSVSPLVIIKGETLLPVSLPQRMQQLHVVGVSVAVFNGGKIEWAKAYGYADKERGIRATPDTLFLAGSISKPVAALAALELVDKGVLDLDANVNDRLKSWHLPDNEFTTEHKVTLHNILNHTGGTTVWGFRGYAATGRIPSTIDVLEGRGNTPAIRVWKVPGESWRYSGGGYVVMQQLLTDVTGRPFPDLMREMVLKPLHMNHSTYEQPLPAGWRAHAASGYDDAGAKIPGGWLVYPEMAAAGLWTTPSDLARYALAVQRAYRSEGGILSSKMTRTMLTPGMANHGLGPIITLDGKRFGHTGIDAGFQASLTAYIDGGAGVAVMTNSDNGLRLADELTLTIAREYGWNGFPAVEKTIVQLPQEAYRRLVGRYRYQGDPGVGEFVIALRDGHLFMQYPDAAPRELLAESETRLLDRITGTEIELQKGSTMLNVIGIGHAERLPQLCAPVTAAC